MAAALPTIAKLKIATACQSRLWNGHARRSGFTGFPIRSGMTEFPVRTRQNATEIKE
jgi:hypothetical protein